MRALKATVAATIVLGPFLDATDGVTPETGLSIAQADVRLSKNAGAFAQKNDATSCTHMENGYYSCPLNTTDTNAAGILSVAVNKAGAIPWRGDYGVLAGTPYNAIVLGTDYLGIDLLRINGLTATVGRLAAFLAQHSVIQFTVAAGTLTDRRFTTDLTGYSADQLRKRKVVMITGTRQGETSLLSAYVATGGDVSIAVPFSGAVSAGDTGILLP